MKKSEIRALSITQPWAQCMLSNGKNVENRTWNTHQRGYIAIHASSSFSLDRFELCKKQYRIAVDPDEVDYGAIVGFAKLVDVVTEEELSASTRKWFEGDYGFVFEDMIPLKEPVPVRGTLNFWKVSGKTLKDCLTQLSETQRKKILSE